MSEFLHEGDTWYSADNDTLDSTTGQQIGEVAGQVLPLAIAAGNVWWNAARYKKLRDQKLKHRTKPYDEVHTTIRPVQKFPTELKASYKQDIAGTLRPKFQSSDPQLTMLGLQGAGAQKAHAMTQLFNQETGYVTQDKARFSGELKEEQLRNAEIRKRNTDTWNEDQAYRERAQLNYLENIQKLGTDTFNQAQQALFNENLYNATAKATSTQNEVSVLKDEIDTLEWRRAQLLPGDPQLTQIKKDLITKRAELDALIKGGIQKTKEIRSDFIPGVFKRGGKLNPPTRLVPK